MNALFKYGSAVLLVLFCNGSNAQDAPGFNKALAIPDKVFGALDKKAASIEEKINRQSARYISKMERQEGRLKKKLYRKDTALARQLFDGMDEKYSQLKRQLNPSTDQPLNKFNGVYSGHLDSLATALQFLKGQSSIINPAMEKTLEQYKHLQATLDASGGIKKYITQRRDLLKQQFERLGMIKKLKRFRKDVYYYQQQVKSYKELFEDPSMVEAKLMEVVMKLPQFRDFFTKNSMLGSLFSLPSGSNTASLAGLQTRAMVNQSLVSHFGSSAVVKQQLQQNVQNAQGQLNQLKNKLTGYSSGSYGNANDADMPGFKANTQKTRSFLHRLEYGGNIQSQRARYFFPVTSDIALSLGYKLNDKSSVGVGASCKIGWGHNWNSIKLSHQGVGLRSYLDWKIRGSFYLSGGYEQNYRSMISSVDQLQNYSAWQASGLVGLSKKYSVSKKIKGEMKLLWDFMSHQQIPKTQPVLFRIGYSLK